MTEAKRIEKIITVLQKAVWHLPDPSVTLVGKKWKSPFLVLISCILSLRTKDQTTLAASQRLFKLAMTPQNMVRLKTEKIARSPA